MVLEQILIATIVVSLVSLVGVLISSKKQEKGEMFLLLMVSFATGTLLAGAFFDLLPESVELLGAEQASFFVLLGLLVFFLLERFVFWHHHHHEDHKHEKPLAYLTLIGDGLHNFFDGAAIAASFMIGPHIGVPTTLAIMAHEIPQEIGDFSLLVYSGFTKSKALLFNLLSAFAAVLGALFFFYFSTIIDNLNGFGLAFTAGMFIYIAGVDLIPELFHNVEKGKHKLNTDLLQTATILLGIVAIYVIRIFFVE
ncbi:MAG TPA: ZIP family metal transporter [Candidatus Bilamarchaeaceae archaeon]|nr:ZIP family metal transporter [Candidatus Bilamarchaeaceae archaeon]